MLECGTMRVRWWGLVTFVGWLVGAGVSGADDPAAPSAGPSLQEQIQTYETLDPRIADLQQQLTKARGRTRRHLEDQLRQLQAEQDRAFEAIEQAVGPLPPAIRPELPVPLESALDARHRRDDAVLERDVDRRLPSS